VWNNLLVWVDLNKEKKANDIMMFLFESITLYQRPLGEDLATMMSCMMSSLRSTSSDPSRRKS
jgi:hypothetical protein